ncbi:kazal-type serine protease inhibitor domain-containing protein 1-like [Protopterus annectens]|uniref:kazal-type serine protease inhibitor domain-containing protein 1-like n=1 Tax=Protopterus annectens TaxID=7888 RepID=UPI001CFC3947|nr:kazal-type serine protease inhibitor domain-containing protein 1-like [Protopterus annectens]
MATLLTVLVLLSLQIKIFCIPFTDQDSNGLGSSCQCDPVLCPQLQGCLAGVVLDQCSCCHECANIEGQSCDLDKKSYFYGHCGDNLECKVDMKDLSHGEIPEPRCVCQFQHPVCGTDRQTYLNICKFNEALHGNSTVNLAIAHRGPCQSGPQIKAAPQDQISRKGDDVIFRCEVFAYPMALIQWKRENSSLLLPGDDAHISVQSRGGPLRYELSSWLQIERVNEKDMGVYYCSAHNKYGSVAAKATLLVTVKDEAPLTKRNEDILAEEAEEYDYY